MDNNGYSPISLIDELYHALQKLPDDQETLIDQRFFQNVEQKKIANLPEVSEATVSRRMGEALMNLHKLCSDEKK